MTTYKIELINGYNDGSVFEQLAIGDYGINWAKNKSWNSAVANRDFEFFIRHATALVGSKRTRDGRFFTKLAAQRTLHNLELFNAIGQGVRRAYGQDAYSLTIKIVEA